MMNQFSSIYGQLFCCSCPGGVAAGARCDNKTTPYTSYPLLQGRGSYAWVAGIICFLILTVSTILGAIYCCRRRRHWSENESISIIRFRNVFFNFRSGMRSRDVRGNLRSGTRSTEVLVEQDNPAFQQPQSIEEDNVVELDNSETKIQLTTSASDDSLDSAFMSRRNSRDQDAMDTKPLATAENYDSS